MFTVKKVHSYNKCIFHGPLQFFITEFCCNWFQFSINIMSTTDPVSEDIVVWVTSSCYIEIPSPVMNQETKRTSFYKSVFLFYLLTIELVTQNWKKDNEKTSYPSCKWYAQHPRVVFKRVSSVQNVVVVVAVVAVVVRAIWKS